MARSLEPYSGLLQQQIAQDHGVLYNFKMVWRCTRGEALEKTNFGQIAPQASQYGRRNVVRYFEVAELAEAFQAVAPKVKLIHPIERQAWGQRVFPF